MHHYLRFCSQTPLRDVASVWDPAIQVFGESLYDDPSLALLFSQLKLKTLQAAKGTSEISGRTEFSFVLQIARVFCRMGTRCTSIHVHVSIFANVLFDQGAMP